jgi:hypothetical protein
MEIRKSYGHPILNGRNKETGKRVLTVRIEGYTTRGARQCWSPQAGSAARQSSRRRQQRTRLHRARVWRHRSSVATWKYKEGMHTGGWPPLGVSLGARTLTVPEQRLCISCGGWGFVGEKIRLGGNTLRGCGIPPSMDTRAVSKGPRREFIPPTVGGEKHVRRRI